MTGSGSGSGSFIGPAIKYQLSKQKRKSGESIEEFAKRLFYVQQDVCAAHAGRDSHETWEGTSAHHRAGWLHLAEHPEEISKKEW